MADDKKQDQEGFLKDHPLESDGSDPSLKKPKPKRVASRFFNALLLIAFFAVFVMSLISFSASSNSYRKLAGTDRGSVGEACALNADRDDNDVIKVGNDGACQFSIGGEVVLFVYAALSIAVMIIKIVGGWSM